MYSGAASHTEILRISMQQVKSPVSPEDSANAIQMKTKGTDVSDGISRYIVLCLSREHFGIDPVLTFYQFIMRTVFFYSTVREYRYPVAELAA